MVQSPAFDGCSYPESKLLEIFYDNSPMMMGIVELVKNEDFVTIRFLSHNAATADFFNLPGQSITGKELYELGLDRQVSRDIISYYEQCEQNRSTLSHLSTLLALKSIKPTSL